MGLKDKTEKYLEAYNDVFADIFNVLVFGKELIKPEFLISSGTETVYKSEDGNIKNQLRDIHKFYNESDIKIATLGIENQTDVDKDMVIRVLGYDYTGYREQIVSSRPIRYPVITIVLNFSSKKWTKPKSLIELFDMSDELKDYVEDYHIKVYDVAYLSKETRDKFKSDFKVVADFFVEKRLGMYDARKHPEKLKHVEAVLELLKVFTEDERYGEIKDTIIKNSKEGSVGMCEILDECINRGREEGEMSILIKMVIKKKISVEEALEEIDIPRKEFERKLKEFSMS